MAAWPNGQGVGFRCQRLEVRVLPRSAGPFAFACGWWYSSRLQARHVVRAVVDEICRYPSFLMLMAAPGSYRWTPSGRDRPRNCMGLSLFFLLLDIVIWAGMSDRMIFHDAGLTPCLPFIPVPTRAVGGVGTKWHGFCCDIRNWIFMAAPSPLCSETTWVCFEYIFTKTHECSLAKT